MPAFTRPMAIFLPKLAPKFVNYMKLVPTRLMGGHGPAIMVVTPSRWQWIKLKDMVHLYACVGFLIATPIVFCFDVFIGPAQLSEIPEGYTPKFHEYFKHPITRWLAKNMTESHQQAYEKFMHMLYEEDERSKLRSLEWQIKDHMQERNDYKAYYYRPIFAKYIRASRASADYLESIRGSNE